MSAPDDGGPAFPMIERQWDRDSEQYVYDSAGGMTLRDYFAAKAMQALLLDSIKAISGNGKDAAKRSVSLVTRSAYEVADDMLKTRGE